MSENVWPAWDATSPAPSLLSSESESEQASAARDARFSESESGGMMPSQSVKDPSESENAWAAQDATLLATSEPDWLDSENVCAARDTRLLSLSETSKGLSSS